MLRLLFSVVVVCFSSICGAAQTPGLVKKQNRVDTIRATLASFGLPNLEGNWKYAGPFPYRGADAFTKALPPDRGVDLTAKYAGLADIEITWKDYKQFQLGKVLNFKKLFDDEAISEVAVFLALEFESKKEFVLPVSLGSDDSLSVYMNGTRVHHEDYSRAAGPDQDRVDLKITVGKNLLVIKVGQYSGGWEVYVAPELPKDIPADIRTQIDKEYPPINRVTTSKSSTAAEAKYYTIDTFLPPEDCVLEVGGLGFRPDGKLLACTRRGEVWLIDNATALNPQSASFTKFASGLHEPLGLHVVDDNTTLIAQRPELTRMTSKTPQGPATTFTTISDRWGISGGYHEYCFGPAVAKNGDAFLTLNVGFSGGHQAKAAWRGWCVKVSPDGTMEPWAYGLRSPNGINFSPEGELFYADNQGEWVASNKLQHLKKGQFYGHQAGLKWIKDSPFAAKGDTVAYGMRYDGVNPAKPDAPKVYPAVDPPVIWFPYGRMGQSVTEPRWDTTAGKFGPFAGQVFLGDQTRSMVMRVAYEQVNGVYQGACFPFRSGLQCGVNRIVFGPDGAMYCGQTDRGWGSTGGKPFGLQRIRFNGEVPPEMLTMKLTKSGFAVTFTQPIDVKTFDAVKSISLKSFTYVYLPAYGCPETDTTAEKVTDATLSADGLTLTFSVPDRAKGRVYELQLNDLKTKSGESLVHDDAYYTLNEFIK